MFQPLTVVNPTNASHSNAPKAAKPRRPQGRLTPHQRLVMKAEALFPGSTFVSESLNELASAS